MKRPIFISSALVFITFLSGCGGDSFQSLAQESLTTLKELISTFDGVKDEASAISSKPKLKSLIEKLNDIQERQKKLGMPTDAQFKEMDGKIGVEMEELQKKMVGHMLRLGFDPKIRAVLDDLDFKPKK